MADPVLEFGDFKLDCGRFELLRAGHSLRLEKKPMELLILLAAGKGRLVTRAEIVESLWGSEVFVDTEHGINTAIRKIRHVLRDNPEKPRFVQTVTGKGYRFIGPVAEVSSTANIALSEPLSTRDDLVDHSAAPIVEAHDPAAERQSRRSGILLGSAAVLLVALGVGIFARGWIDRFLHPAASPKIESLAVIPLDNLSGDPGQEYFADGMTDELITMLAKNSTLHIVSRTSVMQFKGAHRPLPEIARDLHVDGIVEGSVVRSGDKVHLTLQLIHAASDTHLWAESYDRDIANSVSLPSEAARTIAKQLNKVAVSEGALRYISPEAHDNYLRGLYLSGGPGNEEAIPYLKKAVELQPDYTLAWVVLADTYGISSSGATNPKETEPKVEAAIQRAAELDDSLPEVHCLLGAVAGFSRWDWDRALAETTRAVELNPNYARGHYIRARVLERLNRMDESLREMQMAVELDPNYDPTGAATSLSIMRRYDAALDETQLRLKAQPGNGNLHFLLSDIYHQQGKSEESARELAEGLLLNGDKIGAEATRLAPKRDGYRSIYTLLLDELKHEALRKYVSPMFFADIYGRLNRKEEALRLLEEACRNHDPDVSRIQNLPWYNFLHSDARYRALIYKMGLPPAW